MGKPNNTYSIRRSHLSQRLRGRKTPQTSRSPRASSQEGSIPPIYTSPLLPLEIINRVADFTFEFFPPTDDSSNICCIKPPWSDVAGFMNASYDLHRMGFLRWITIVDIKISEDWEMAKEHSRWVRELRCADGVLIIPQHRLILAQFEHLYAVSIDAHRDVARNSQNQFAYQDLFRALPSSLRRLEITRAHGPDVRVIATVKECCPNIEELRLGRCTMFNCSPACEFWESFPFDHDSYMSDQDSDAYARSLSKELKPLNFLESLQLGLYLIPSTTVLAHRLYHRRNLPAPAVIEWQQAIPQMQPLQTGAQIAPAEQLIALLHERDLKSEFGPRDICVKCIETVEEIGRRAEASASTILQELLPSLGKVQWMSWLSPGHLGLNTYTRFSAP